MKPMTEIRKTSLLAMLLFKEHMKEPSSLLWSLLSPCLIFYGMRSAQSHAASTDYLTASKWYYAYIAMNVALFGFSLYLIGRRESGFVRSFIYTAPQKIRYLMAHTASYSIIAILYCLCFYLITKPAFASYAPIEMAGIAWRFYLCFLMFCTFGSIVTVLPMRFQTAGTLLSAVAFALVITGLFLAQGGPWEHSLASLNPVTLAGNFIGAQTATPWLIAFLPFFVIGLVTHVKYFRVNPVWNRY